MDLIKDEDNKLSMWNTHARYHNTLEKNKLLGELSQITGYTQQRNLEKIRHDTDRSGILNSGSSDERFQLLVCNN